MAVSALGGGGGGGLTSWTIGCFSLSWKMTSSGFLNILPLENFFDSCRREITMVTTQSRASLSIYNENTIHCMHMAV